MSHTASATPAVRDTTGTVVDPATLTLAQVVDSGYAWGTNELTENTVIAAAHATTDASEFGDSLLQFLLSELAEGPSIGQDDPQSLDAWTEARRRCDQIVEEVLSVQRALGRFGPQA